MSFSKSSRLGDELSAVLYRLELLAKEVLFLEFKFLQQILRLLKNTIPSNNIHMIVLGCGTPTEATIPLMKSSRYQWVVAIIIIKLLKITRVHIYDPVMTDLDYRLWDTIIEKLEVEDDLLRKLTKVNTRFFQIDDETDELSLILWMPHCEAFLYQHIIEGILKEEHPLIIAKSLNPDGSKVVSAELVIDDSMESTKYSIGNTVLVGNSLFHYHEKDSNYLNNTMKIINEQQLKEFNTHAEAFNDTYITSFNNTSE